MLYHEIDFLHELCELVEYRWISYGFANYYVIWVLQCEMLLGECTLH